MKYHLLVLFLIVTPTCFLAQTVLSKLFSNHMVLQQNSEVSIWGNDIAQQPIKVSGNWGTSNTTIANKNGKWLLKLKTPKAGGPYTLDVKGSKNILLEDIMIGEVWFCSGQSNMEMPLRGYPNEPVLDSNEAILNSTNNNIRVFNITRNASLKITDTLNGNWSIASPKTSPNYSATAYFFAKKIEKILGIPIGIITSSWGGSKIEAWMDAPSLTNFSDAKKKSSKDKLPHRHPSVLYNGMVKPAMGYTIKGVIWYQGEANRGNYWQYTSLMQNMVGSWRKQWGIGDFPFYYAQIAPFMYPLNTPSVALIREAQLKASQTIPNVGMAVILDTGSPSGIHPMEKKEVGNRLAYWALAKDYHIDGLSYKSPEVEKINYLESGNVEIIFENTANGISSFGKEVTNFELAGVNKIFYPAKATITLGNKNTVTITSKKVKKPIAVRYAFKNYAKASIFSSSGLPISSFRSDNWSVE